MNKEHDTVKQHYDRFPQQYAHIEGDTNSSLDCKTFTYFLSCWEPTMPIVDVGCGTGRVGRRVATVLDPKELVFMDLSNNSIKQARSIDEAQSQNHTTNSLYIQGDLLHPPLADLQYCVCHGVAHHTPEPIQALQNLFLMLAPGGFLYLTVYGKSWYERTYKGARWLRWCRNQNHEWLVNGFYALYYPLRTIMRYIETRELSLDDNLRARFEDFLMTPYAAFFSEKTLLELFQLNGMEVLMQETLNLGVLHSFVLKKTR